MTLTDIDRTAKLSRIDWATLPAKRPRVAGKNARLPDVHGIDINVLMCRITFGDIRGIGWSAVSKDVAQKVVGKTVGEMLDASDRIKPEFRPIEIPLLDYLGQAPGHPVYGLIDPHRLDGSIFKARCYDTSLYMDDLEVDDASAVKLQKEHSRYGLDHGHRNFKMKIGRGARHMPTDKGLARDIMVVNAVRETIGPDGALLVDANNGYTLNLAKTFLTETKSSKLFFIEEPFHEDPPVSRALKDWMKEQGMATLLADGEGAAAVHLVDWAKDGVIDALQYDIFNPGFTRWLELCDELRETHVKVCPHHYGAILGNFVTPHLSAASENFLFDEWDEAKIDGLDTSAYRVRDGYAEVPNAAGFGLKLDHAFFDRRVREIGWSVE